MGGTTIIDTALANLTEDNGGIQGYIKMTSGSDAGNARRIKNGTSGYTASSTTITVNFAFSGQIASGVSFELHRFDPDIKRLAINRAIENLYPLLYLELRDHSVMIDNRLSNSHFGTYSGGFTGWTAVGSPTVTQESTIVRMPGAKSAKVVASGANGQLTQAPHMSRNEMTGKDARAHFWVYATGANAARVRLDWDGSTIVSSDYHSGKDQWELLKVEGTVPDGATQIKTILEVTDGSTAYFANGFQSVGPIWRYTVPSTFLQGPHYVDMQQDENEPDGVYSPLRGSPVEGFILQLRGMGLLSRPTTDSGTTEVDGAKVDLIVAKAAEMMFQGMVTGDEGNLYHTPEYWRNERAARESRPGARMMPMGSAKSNGYWTSESDSSGHYIRLTAGRGI